jgi:hypothetical protein
MERVKVVVHFADHRIIKGFTQDFFPNKQVFHLYPVDATEPKDSVEIMIKDLKAVFFVRTFEGNKDYHDRKEFEGTDQLQGRKVAITFSDGEVIVGSTLGYDPSRPGFFLFPVDPQSNNMRVFCISKAVKDVRYL